MKKFSIVIICIFALFSCRKKVDVEDVTFNPKPVLNSILLSGELIKTQLSLTNKFNSNEFKYIENARVSLFVDDIYKEDLAYAGMGEYYSTIIAEPNKKYNCVVTMTDYGQIDCSDIIPPITNCYNIQHIKNAGVNIEGDKYSAVKFTFTNNNNIKQYFEAKIKLIHNDGSFEYGQIEKITDPVLLKEGLPISVFSNENINDNIYTMTINYSTGTGFNDMYPLILEFRSISYNYYQFAKHLYLYQLGRYPEGIGSSSSPYQIYSNINNGSGIFAGYSAFNSDTIYP